ncbi:MAG: glycoside hydrolase family 88 protein, partial [Planctomycetes bacterium]|nr:glycoside hydrolase family 88 protein [Planctomycetota bacterium]
MKDYWGLVAAVVCLWSSWCGADDKTAVSLAEIRRQALAYVDACQAPGEPLGHYFDSPADRSSPSLYASCDVAHLRTVMGEDLQTTLTPDQRRQWIDHINSFAGPDGTYGPARKNHSAQHANGMVVGALGVLGGRQKYVVRLYDDFDGVDEIGPWLEKIDWQKQWSGSHLFWGGMHCFSMSRRCTDAWRKAVLDWLDANVDPQTGWWRKGVSHAGPAEPLGGGAHIWPIYQHQRRPFPCPERVIDSILAMQKPDGQWLRYGNYLDLDALYGLKYMSSVAPGYRREDILQAARRHGLGLIQQWPAILAGQPDLHSLLAAIGAFGLLQQLLPETFLDDAHWTDIFSDARLYQTAQVEVLDGEDDILPLLHRVNNWQIAHPRMKPNDRNWERGTWYTGVMAAYKSTGDETFLQQALDWGRQHQWQVGAEKAGANRLFCVETWAELYFIKEDKTMIQPALRWLDTKADNSPAGAKVWYLEGGRRYADSLYGACAVAMMAKATGDKKYLDHMHAFFWDVHAELYDKDDGLFYRDKRFIGQATRNGKKVFWSRGNGWV